MLQPRESSTGNSPPALPLSFAARGRPQRAAPTTSEGALLASGAGRRAHLWGGAEAGFAATSSFSFAAPGAASNAMRHPVESTTSTMAPRAGMPVRWSQVVDSTARVKSGSRLQHLNRSRYYDPHTGRFTSEDPLGFKVDINWYPYVKNRPTLLVDPYGEAPSDPVIHLPNTLHPAGNNCKPEADLIFWAQTPFNPLLHPGIWERYAVKFRNMCIDQAPHEPRFSICVSVLVASQSGGSGAAGLCICCQHCKKK
jgi:RHS repeat-associated protein